MLTRSIVHAGHVFPGANLPFGMAKAVSDVVGERQGGFALDNSAVSGFSHMHDSGTGGGASFGNFPLFAQSGCPGDELNRCKFNKNDRAVNYTEGSPTAHPGYFSIQLNTSITAEMTTTNHTALYRFTFPNTPVPPFNLSGENEPGQLSPLLLADLADLSDSRINGTASVDPDTGRMTGSGTFVPTFGIGSYRLHFCADFQGASVRETGVFVNNRAGPEPKNITMVEDGLNNSPQILPAGVYTWFNAPEQNNQIVARVGVSFMSVEQACNHAETEIPDFDFNATESAAQEAWANKFSVVSIDTGAVNESLQTTFWSGFYRAHISPQDYTGENYLWESDEPYYDSFYCMWDSFRVIHQAITLFDPYSQTQMMRTLLDVYRHEGKLPDCRMSLCKGFTQGGSSADVVLVDAFLKNITQGIDWELCYQAIVSDAEEEPLNWAVEGRGGLTSWKSLNYIPADDFDPLGTGLFTRSVSRTIEYAYNDFCIAEMAREMGNQGDYEKYIESSHYWRNVWKQDQTSFMNETDTGFTGFLMPRYLNGTFGYQDTFTCSLLQNFTSCYLNPGGLETYEGSPWLYSFLAAPGDMAALIAAMGGRNEFVRRLDFWHEYPELAYMGNEQPFQTIFQYHHAGRPGKSAQRVHQYIPSQFNDSVPVGIPGNDDSGAMGSFVALTMMGIFPNPGTNHYYLTPPFFPEVNLTNGMTGNTITIRNINFDADYNNMYIQDATLNGEPYTKNYITHDFFLEGGLLELTLGANESSTWGTTQADSPPSLTTDNGIWS